MDGQQNTEFKIFSKSIEIFSIYYGIFLIIWGIIVSFLSESKSMTSYIPSFFGFLIVIFSTLSIKFVNKKKLFMHIVVTLGLVIFVCGMDIFRIILKNNFLSNFWADLSKVMMLFTGAYFTFVCIKSFIHARRNKISD